MVSIRVLGSVRGCEDGLTRHRSVDCHPGRGWLEAGLVEVSRAYTCWHTFMGGTLTASFHHEPRRVPAGRWVAQRVRRLASVWLGSNIQRSLEVTHPPTCE